MYKNIIFDFDGTLNDSRDYTIQTFFEITKNKVGDKFKDLRDKSPKEILEEFKGATIGDIKRRFKLSLFSIIRTISKVQEEQYKFVSNNDKDTVLSELPYYEGTIELVRELNDSGRQVYLLSSNKKKVLDRMLALADIENYFKEVVGGTKILGKYTKIRSLMKKYKMKSDETVYIGDETRDIEAAKKAGIDMVSVSWGYSGEKLLQRYAPTYIANNLEALQNILKGKKTPK
ncbi:MAG TPA: HAD-IA family hydrolase [Candidatus Dojkabacteria bacterium]|nr:HAD-IA family hydrolase [Candidatus Dojkabacteria bacterium]